MESTLLEPNLLEYTWPKFTWNVDRLALWLTEVRPYYHVADDKPSRLPPKPHWNIYLIIA